MTLVGSLLCLRPTKEEDLDFVTWAERHEENRRYVEQWTLEQHRGTLIDRGVHFILERIEDTIPVGYVILHDSESPNGSVNLKRLVITEKGSGYGRMALRLVERFAFEELGAHRLWLEVKEQNMPARRLYESEGFVVEGTLRERLRNGDSYESLVVMSVLESEYAA